MKTNRRACGWIVAGLIATAGYAGQTWGQAGGMTAEQRENLLALSAKLLCSGVFVVERDADEFIENDLQRSGPVSLDWDRIEVDIDRERKRVTLSMDGIPPRTAIYLGSQGCSLLPKGKDNVTFEPVQFEPELPDAAATAWPMGDVITQQGSFGEKIDYDALEAALDFAFDDSLHAIPQRTRAMVVVHGMQIVGERYAPGFDQDTRHINWSMGKSITAALIGILVGEGHFTVEDRAPVAAWQGADDPRRDIRIKDLLRMSGGLDFDRGAGATRFTDRDHHTYVYFAAPNVFEYSVKRDLQYEPGTNWRYRNCDPLTLGKIVRETVEKSGREYLTFPQRALFDKIGMRHMVLECDPYGNFIMTGFEYGTARDWARFGLLHLRDGEWFGERILPEGWVDFVRTPAPADSGKGYGGLFWLNAGKGFETLPADMFWPAGHMGQSVFIIPSRDLVVVRLGHSSDGGYDSYIEQVLGKILAAIGPAPTLPSGD